MIPAAFDYQRAASVDEAVGLLGEHGDDAKLLAGGHSLLPLMRLRLAAPAVLVDIGRLEDLSYVRSADGQVRIGALCRHHDLATSDEVREQVPLLAHVAGQIGDPQVRHRGTIGGSIAHGDPASDLPAALLALRSTLVARGPGGEREIPADEMFTGFLETALGPDEVLTEIRVPAVGSAPWGFQKFVRRAQDWAIVGAAAVLGNGNSGGPGVGLVNMGATPLRAAGVEEALRGGASPGDAAARADEGTEPTDDLNASAEYRRHLARVLVRRALESAGA
ncbi:MAG TPA: xanthine dehydrogenase family protein subunit M [Acidimicrobiales bacterium]|jgi:carbon-monoxide dehydrogenase medium subunit|nr:xanthine dehydrogenase family protein subunit M [Acidimicrobiales bacterium]